MLILIIDTITIMLTRVNLWNQVSTDIITVYVEMIVIC